MVRPIKLRNVEGFPETAYFAPPGRKKCDMCEYVLKIEELEAMRLKDVQGLNQYQCAEKMGISRQTFGNIIDSAREKVARALTSGGAIRIAGGNYATRVCALKCFDCGHIYDVNLEQDKRNCPRCGSKKVGCEKKAAPCKRWCWENANTKW
ncbi:MAG: DUF134 domain-containing protein [Eubacteriales bacterium]|nr:DUF134 domain-containing protein [Eubacteriales bacterium]